ncbi:hypothetical protein FOA22_22430 [Heyndrickxia oleronia]|uniref:hypothetical protein n=1 Tax=Heyndrickxia oleronia TaxID=38875 RepID=UPI0033386231
MHPKQIVSDFQSMGSSLVLDSDDLYIEHPENIYPELEKIAKQYKARIVAYLKNDYSDQEHNIFQTVDKILNFYVGIEQDMNKKINDWLNHDDTATKLIMKLCVELSNNGWKNPKEPTCNYEDLNTFKLSKEIYERAMAYFKKGA